MRAAHWNLIIQSLCALHTGLFRVYAHCPTGLFRVYAGCTLDYSAFMCAAHWILQILFALLTGIQSLCACTLDYSELMRNAYWFLCAAHWILLSLCALHIGFSRVYERCTMDSSKFMHNTYCLPIGLLRCTQ
jgi:hypothetical protein